MMEIDHAEERLEYRKWIWVMLRRTKEREEDEEKKMKRMREANRSGVLKIFLLFLEKQEIILLHRIIFWRIILCIN